MPIAMMSSERDGEILQVHTDHLGTPRAVSDKEQNILWKWEGDQFGDVMPQVATITMPLRHAGQYADKESGLFYNYFRYYDPKSGRYLRSDPIGLEGGLNTYGYVGNDALGAIDPYGLFYVPGVGDVIPPSIPQDSYEVLLGYSDALSFGIGPYARNAVGIDAGFNISCSKYYSYGETTSILVGGVGTGRATYMFASKALARSSNPTVLKRGSQIRNFSKRYLGPAIIPHRSFQGFRDKIKPWEIWVKSKGFDKARAGLGRTDEDWNNALIPFSVGQGGRVNKINREDCGCE